jgi:hypothetical protein
MDFASILTVFSAAIGGVLSYWQFVATRRSQEETEEALAAAREPKVDQALVQGDLKGLGDYFFNTLGRLPLADYADDREARGIVSDAVRNVETFVNPDSSSVSEGADALIRIDTRRIETDIAMGDFWGGLSRLRRRIELALRDVAMNADIPVERMGPNQILQRLVRANAIPPGAEGSLRRAVSICNRGVHGEVVSGEEVEEALALAEDGLAAIGQA